MVPNKKHSEFHFENEITPFVDEGLLENRTCIMVNIRTCTSKKVDFKDFKGVFISFCLICHLSIYFSSDF